MSKMQENLPKQKMLKNIGSILLIGAGKMGMAMARGWLQNGLDPNKLVLIDPSPQKNVQEYAKQKGIKIFPKLDKLENIAVKIVVLAVKPQIFPNISTELREKIAKDVLVISIAAGIDIATLQKELANENIIRAMPNTPAQLAKAVSGAICAKNISAQDKKIANALLSAIGKVEWLEKETKFDALMLVSGCGPAYVFLLAEAMAKAGIEQGLEEKQALSLARQTIIGAAALMEDEKVDIAQLRENVTSKGGVTEAALEVLMGKEGIFTIMSNAFLAGLERNKKLSNKL